MYLHRWGYTAKRPRRHARKQDPEEIRRWLDETYPAIERRAEVEGAAIHWCDETGRGRPAPPLVGMRPEGEPVTMEVPGPHDPGEPDLDHHERRAVRFMTYTRTMERPCSWVSWAAVAEHDRKGVP